MNEQYEYMYQPNTSNCYINFYSLQYKTVASTNYYKKSTNIPKSSFIIKKQSPEDFLMGCQLTNFLVKVIQCFTI